MNFIPGRAAALALAISGSVVRANAADLAWTTTAAHLAAEPGQKEAVAIYPFHNDSGHIVRIKSVTASCSCTTAQSDKLTLAPGESGKITATFTVADRTGTEEKTITVVTDAADGQPAQLTLEVKIRAYARVDPGRVSWLVGENAVEKTVRCEIEAAPSATVIGVHSSDPAIRVSVDPIAVGKSYAIHLQPVSTSRRVTAAIELRLDIAGVGPRIYRIYAYILPAG